MWLCHCGLRNSGLNLQCAGINQSILGSIEHYQISNNKPDWMMAVVAGRELNVTPQEELYSKFYNQGKLLVKDMDITQLREHRETLSQIAFEAKATLAAADDELRERKAKAGSKKEWTLTPSGPDSIHTDAINAVAVRKKRMSQLDKTRLQLLALGMDKEVVDEMVRNLERKATETSLKSVSFGKTTTDKVVDVVINSEPVVNTDPKPNPFTKLVQEKQGWIEP
jgi:hypothetical protein